MFNAGGQLTHFVSAVDTGLTRQVAARDMANAVDKTVQRGDKGVLDTEPDADNHAQHYGQHADQDPDSHAVGAVAAFHGDVIQAIVLRHVFGIGFLETVLIFLGRLVEEFVDFSGREQLNQLRQRAVIDVVVTLDLLRVLFALARIARQGLVLRPVRFRLFQGAAGDLHQLLHRRAAANVARIHHVADTGAV
ncbi:hypothetical protein BN136_3331 [Cronobacter universalis NCTC 9529]|nr:hypothetical protein BN136_3331 [Cronobacter universalis NCTC 9529]